MVTRAKSQTTPEEFALRLAALGMTKVRFAERSGLSAAMVGLYSRSHKPSATALRLVQFEELLSRLNALLLAPQERIGKRRLRGALAKADPEVCPSPNRTAVKHRRPRLSNNLQSPKHLPKPDPAGSAGDLMPLHAWEELVARVGQYQADALRERLERRPPHQSRRHGDDDVGSIAHTTDPI